MSGGHEVGPGKGWVAARERMDVGDGWLVGKKLGKDRWQEMEGGWMLVMADGPGGVDGVITGVGCHEGYGRGHLH